MVPDLFDSATGNGEIALIRGSIGIEGLVESAVVMEAF